MNENPFHELAGFVLTFRPIRGKKLFEILAPTET
jgi:hypothetical protein